MASENILVDIRSGVCTLTVNRPDKLNALNRQTLLDLDAAFLRAERDDSIRVLVLTGAGDRAFVAGADIGEIRGLSRSEEHTSELQSRGHVVCRLLAAKKQ